MNLHLFLDVVAGTWGTMFTLFFVLATANRGSKHGASTPVSRWLAYFMIATLCWAWIIAS